MDAYTESSGIDTSPDMNSSSDRADDFPSPDRLSMLKPRTLIYDESDDMPAIVRPNDHFDRNVNMNNNNINNHKNNNKSGSDDDAKKVLDDDESLLFLHRNHKHRNSGIGRPLLRPTSFANPPKMDAESPPYRKVRALRLFDTPATPKTIIQKSSSLTARNNTPPNSTAFPISIVPATPNAHHQRPKAIPIHNKMLDSFVANINPFSPNNLLQSKKRSRAIDFQSLHMPTTTTGSTESLANKSYSSIHSMGDDTADETIVEDERQAPKRLALQDSNIPRYEKEFVELGVIGFGEFGVAYECLNRLDGCVYAIKKSIKPVEGSMSE